MLVERHICVCLCTHSHTDLPIRCTVLAGRRCIVMGRGCSLHAYTPDRPSHPSPVCHTRRPSGRLGVLRETSCSGRMNIATKDNRNEWGKGGAGKKDEGE